MTRPAALVLTLALAVAGCGGGGNGGGGDDRLVVAAASSLKGAFTALGGARFSFAGSDQLAAQIRQGVKPDVFAAANTALPAELHSEGLTEKPVAFTGNRLVLAVPADGASLSSLSDLERPGIDLAVGSASVPVGSYTRALLARLGPVRSRRILANVRTAEPDVSGIVGKLTQGAVDAGFVYATDVTATKGELEALELPARLKPSVQYAVAVVKDAPHPAAARRFVASLLRGDGRRELEAAGFTAP